jgi:alpha-L-fucosidase
LAPGSIVTQTLFSDPVNLGTATADATGELASTVTIPSTVPLGSHTLRLQGTANTGDPFTLDVGVTVATPAVALGANPILAVKQTTVKGTRVLDLRTRDVQARCMVTFTAGTHKAKVRADRTGTARAHITLPNHSKRGVIVTARITGKGCAPVQVTRRP